MKALDVALGPIALALLAKRHPKLREPTPKDELNALLAKRKTPAHKAAIAFEKAYGKLVFPDHGYGAGWEKAGETPWLVGAGACLSSEVTFAAPGKNKLVPVVYTTNDNVCFLDATGAAWAEDAVEDPKPVRFAKNARTMLTKLLVNEYVFVSPETSRLTVPSNAGVAIAKALAAKRIADASDDRETWWSDGKVYVVERDGATEVHYATRAQLVLARKAAGVPPPKKAPPEKVTFDSAMRDYPRVSVVLPGLPGKLEAVYRSFLARLGPRAEIGAAVTLAEGAIRGEITAVEIDVPHQRRIQLRVSGDAASARFFGRGPARVEIFFRDFSTSTFLNVFQYGAKDDDAVRALWDRELAPWIAGLEKT